MFRENCAPCKDHWQIFKVGETPRANHPSHFLLGYNSRRWQARPLDTKRRHKQFPHPGPKSHGRL